jgi:hypothetical protein
MRFRIVTQRVEETELEDLLRQIQSDDRQALRDIKVLALPREGRYLVIWEQRRPSTP